MGLMSGTSLDGVDLSMVETAGYDGCTQIYDKYYEFDDHLRGDLIFLRESIKNSKDLQKNSLLISKIEKKFTLFNAKIVTECINTEEIKPNFIGFHGQTIYHNFQEKISKQIGDGELLSQLTKCTIINKFRQQNLENNGQGAPLTPIFHYLIS